MSRIASLLDNILKYRFLSTAAFTVVGTGAYVYHRDYQRYPRMVRLYASGNILHPLQESNHLMPYFRRPELEARLRAVITPSFTNEYYIIVGEVGSGKTRLLKKIVSDMMEEQKNSKQGAPVYVLASQGISFPESLAKAVDFRFDEHIKLRYFMDFLLKIQSFPSKDEHHKLQRVLDAIEESASLYVKEYNKPVVIVIDGATYIRKHLPSAMERLQEKAKFWADENLIKVIFAFNDLDTEELMQNNIGLWSRAAQPIRVGDLKEEEAKRFMHQMAKARTERTDLNFPVGKTAIPSELVENVVGLVGGRMYHLLVFVYDWMQNIPFEETKEKLKDKEFSKFLAVKNSAQAVSLIRDLNKVPGKTMLVTNVMRLTSEEVIDMLNRHGIICFEKKNQQLWVKFDSKLTEAVVQELYSHLK